jgi:hypothetical protein
MPMPAPITTFDAEYSDPAATATGWEETRKVLEEAELFWVSTVRADGRPVRAHAKGDPFDELLESRAVPVSG